jgi:hypothetical protein
MLVAVSMPADPRGDHEGVLDVLIVEDFVEVGFGNLVVLAISTLKLGFL